MGTNAEIAFTNCTFLCTVLYALQQANFEWNLVCYIKVGPIEKIRPLLLQKLFELHNIQNFYFLDLSTLRPSNQGFIDQLLTKNGTLHHCPNPCYEAQKVFEVKVVLFFWYDQLLFNKPDFTQKWPFVKHFFGILGLWHYKLQKHSAH